MGEIVEFRKKLKTKGPHRFCTDDFLDAMQLKIEDLKKEKLAFEGEKTLKHLLGEMVLFIHYMIKSWEELSGECGGN